MKGRKYNVTDLRVVGESAADERHTREQSERLLDHSLQVFHLGKVSVGGSPRRALEDVVKLLHYLIL